jgi:hypothetical protein
MASFSSPKVSPALVLMLPAARMPWHDRSGNVQLPDQPYRQKFFPVDDDFVFFQQQCFAESDTRGC